MKTISLPKQEDMEMWRELHKNYIYGRFEPDLGKKIYETGVETTKDVMARLKEFGL